MKKKKTLWEEYIKIYKNYHGKDRDPVADLIGYSIFGAIILIIYGVSQL